MKANYQNLKCYYCGKRFKPGNTRAGVPNGLGFVMKSGKTYTVCQECVSYKHEEVGKFIDEREREHT
mgnify:CR=1 FL=1